MRIKSLLKSKKVLFISLTLIILATSLFLPKELFAGYGYIEEGIPHKLNLNLLLMYDADQESIDLWEEAFNRASKLLYNSTEGQMQIGTVNVYVNHESFDNFADIWVDNKIEGRATAPIATNNGDKDDKGLGDLGHISLFRNHKFDFEGMESIEDSYGQIWIPNTPEGFGTFYTSEEEFPAFDDLIDKKDNFKSGMFFSIEKYPIFQSKSTPHYEKK